MLISADQPTRKHQSPISCRNLEVFVKMRPQISLPSSHSTPSNWKIIDVKGHRDAAKHARKSSSHYITQKGNLMPSNVHHSAKGVLNVYICPRHQNVISSGQLHAIRVRCVQTKTLDRLSLIKRGTSFRFALSSDADGQWSFA